MAYTHGNASRYRGSLGDYKAVNFVLPSNSPNGMSGLAQGTISTTTLVVGGLAAAAIYWFGFRKKK